MEKLRGAVREFAVNNVEKPPGMNYPAQQRRYKRDLQAMEEELLSLLAGPVADWVQAGCTGHSSMSPHCVCPGVLAADLRALSPEAGR